ncbi:nuclear transport factor 2 family protein [bacterium]|nr:MAG: nuclear transport factor 2 family protein [bacterium]
MVEVHEERLRDAMLAGNVDELTLLLNEELAFVGPDGNVWSKAEDLDSHRTGRLRLSDLSLSERTYRRMGDVVVVIAKTRLAGEFEGTPIAGDYRYTRIWRRFGEETGDDWQIVAGHCSPIAA